MTCRHEKGDPNCSTYGPRRYASSDTPDKNRFEIVQAEAVGPHLVVMALYPNCSHCAYEGRKVMVFENTTPLDALRWRVIDPHFRLDKGRTANQAPSPAARFPASNVGWDRAIRFAQAIGGLR